MAIETAAYEVLESDGKVEIRSYAPLMTAAVEEKDIENTSGFGTIFQYIGGNNENREKISMTTPVINELHEEGSTTEFVMPSKYDNSTLPKPSNEKVKIKLTEARVVLCITFNGRVTDERVKYFKHLLLHYAKTKDLETTGVFRLARYNPPFVPAVFRHNELMIDLKGYEKP